MEENIQKFTERLRELVAQGKKKKSILEIQEINDFFADMELEAEQMEKGKKKHTGTFVVQVSHCDNATWQGEVTWAEANKKKSFRSALELIRLIDGALEVDE